MTVALDQSLPEEEALRANVYSLLARQLARPVGADDLASVAGYSGDATPFGQAIGTLAAVAARTDSVAVGREYHDLFIGVGRGELLPYASYYLTGFLHEKPLARLRQDLALLGVERDPSVTEPEDHMAAILDVMSGLITGTFGRRLGLDEQKRFFETHVDSWGDYFFRDLEQARSSAYYAALGRLAREFLGIERAAFAMV